MDGAIAGHRDAIIQNQSNAANESVCALTSVFTTCGLLHVPVASCTSAFPIHAFYMIVHFNTHRTTAFQSSVFQNIAAALRTHTLPEAMNSYSPSYFRLISPFRHVIYSPKKQGPKAPCNFSSYVRGGVVLDTNSNHPPTPLFKKGDRKLYNTPWACQMTTSILLLLAY
jgi:hypothetical protein